MLNGGSEQQQQKWLKEGDPKVEQPIAAEVKAPVDKSPENISKFDFLSLTEEEPVKISTGLVKECRANFECKVERSELIGDHTLLIAKVLAIHYEEEMHRSDLVVDLNKATPCIHYRKSVCKNREKHIFITGTNELLEIEKQVPTLDSSGQEKDL